MTKNAAADFIAVIDYGAGNVRSAARALEYVIERSKLNLKVELTSCPDKIAAANRIVLPGQGAFGQCMKALSNIDGMIDALEESVLRNKTPFLGICVGMQLLADISLEHGKHKGLGWISGQVVPMKPLLNLKVPHMGWNEVNTTSEGMKHPLFQGIDTHEHFYFVHSFIMECEDETHTLARCEYGQSFTCAVGRENIAGVQFHPEKSQNAGLDLLDNFIKWRPQ